MTTTDDKWEPGAQLDDDWRAWRAKGIGASDVGAILGISPFGSRYTVYADKVEGISFDGNDYTDFGRRAERMLAEWFHDRTGLWVCGEQTWCDHPVDGWQRATVDGFVCESQYSGIVEALGVWEAKTTGLARWDEIPPHYQAQVQWQLHVTGLDRAWIGCLHGRRFEVYELERDQADIDFIVEEVTAFYAEHIVERIPPVLDGSQAAGEVLRRLYPTHTPEASVEVPISLMADIVTVMAEAKRWAEREAALKNQLRALIGEASVATVYGQKAATWKDVTKHVVDTHMLEADHPDLVEKYRVAKTSPTLRITYKSEEDE